MFYLYMFFFNFFKLIYLKNIDTTKNKKFKYFIAIELSIRNYVIKFVREYIKLTCLFT